SLPFMGAYNALRQGSYDGVTLTPNAQLVFEDVQLEELAATAEKQQVHIHIGTASATEPSLLLPQIVFKNCRHLRGDFGGNTMSLIFENCTIHDLHTGEQGGIEGDLLFSYCKFKPVFETSDKS